jgi:hypothetical protein
LLCDLKYYLFWRKFHGLLRRMYIVLLQDRILYRHLSGTFDLWCHSMLKFLCWFFFFFGLDDLSICVRGVLKSPTITMLVLSVFLSPVVKSGTLTLGTCKLTIVISSWWISPFISIKWPSLSLLTNLGLKPSLSDISIATLAYPFGGTLTW